MSGGLDPFPSLSRLRELHRERTGQELVLAGETPKPSRAAVPEVVEDAPPIGWPLRILLPWSSLCSDNVRKMAVVKMVHGKPVAEMMLTPEYRRAKGLIRDHARPRVGKALPVAIPLALIARVWVPDDTRAHDVANFAKVTHDALEGVVYTKDRWLYRVTWERAGVDVDAPRAEVTITPLPVGHD